MSDEVKDTVAFDYIKSSHFRTVHADGVIGSLTPAGGLHFAIYSERPAIPRRIVHAVDAEGRLGAEIPELTDSRNSIVRELEVDVFLSISGAKALADWLLRNIEASKE